GHEDPGRDAELARGEGNGESVITPRGRDHSRRRHRPGQNAGQRAARLERAGVLKQLELEEQWTRRKAEVGRVDLDQGRAAYVWADEIIRGGDRLLVHDTFFHAGSPAHRARWPLILSPGARDMPRG